jgi:predicted class III extradiol MEMO1 family dioxygenase
MKNELIIECIALLNTANFQETLNEKRNEIVGNLKEQLTLNHIKHQKELLIKSQSEWLILNTSLDIEKIIDFTERFK